MSIFSYYILLAFFGVGIFAYTVYKKKKADLFAFFLAATALSWMGEFFVLFLFDAYIYKPGVFTDPFAENTLGHFIPNTFLWGTTSVLVGAFSLRYRWICLISVAYMLIEILFLKLRAYEHYWWRTYMTGIAVFIFLAIIKTWYSKLNEKRYESLRNVTFFFIAFFLISIPNFCLILLGKQHYSVHLFENMYRDSAVFAHIYQAGMSFVYTFFVCILKRWYWKMFPFLIFLLSDSILVNMNILIFHDGWNLLYLTLTRTIGLAIFILHEKYTLKLNPVK